MDVADQRSGSGRTGVGQAFHPSLSPGDELVGSLVGDAEEVAHVAQGKASLVEFPGRGSDVGGGGRLGLGGLGAELFGLGEVASHRLRQLDVVVDAERAGLGAGHQLDEILAHCVEFSQVAGLGPPVHLGDMDRPADALPATTWWRLDSNLSFGDRFCLALAERLSGQAVTADTSWRDLPEIDVLLIR